RSSPSRIPMAMHGLCRRSRGGTLAVTDAAFASMQLLATALRRAEAVRGETRDANGATMQTRTARPVLPPASCRAGWGGVAGLAVRRVRRLGLQKRARHLAQRRWRHSESVAEAEHPRAESRSLGGNGFSQR